MQEKQLKSLSLKKSLKIKECSPFTKFRITYEKPGVKGPAPRVIKIKNAIVNARFVTASA